MAPAPPPADPLGARVADAVRRNRRRALVLAVAGAVPPALVLGLVLGFAVSLVAGVVAGAAALIVLTASFPVLATPIVLRLLGARPLGPDEGPRLHNVIDGLCPTFGVRRPAVWVVDDTAPNACCLGPAPSRGVLVVTSSLVGFVDLIELEGVIGHELAHLKRGDIRVSVVAAAVLLPLVWLTGRDELVHSAVGRGRELGADRLAAAMLRYPPGLHRALLRLETGPAPSGPAFNGRRLALLRWLWIDPTVGRREAAPVGDLDVTSVRVATLAEL
jgi:Zn-dependent protease with chaperone function